VSAISPPSHRTLGLLVVATFVLAACSANATEPTGAPASTVEPTGAAGSTVEAEPTAEAEPAAEAASWLDIELTDAATGASFTLASLRGEVVAIEPMAVWCSNCKAQQDNVKQAYGDIQAAGVRYISLGIDPGEDPATLARYAERRGYEWTFVPSPTELSRALSDLFGPQILSAPSTPLIVLDAQGEVATQAFGFHGPEELIGILEAAA